QTRSDIFLQPGVDSILLICPPGKNHPSSSFRGAKRSGASPESMGPQGSRWDGFRALGSARPGMTNEGPAPKGASRMTTEESEAKGASRDRLGARFPAPSRHQCGVLR